MADRWSRCTNTDCPEAAQHTGTGLCPDCRRAADKARRPTGNPYNSAGHKAFRSKVLDRDPICVACNTAYATVADHHPIERRDLVSAGLDPNDPQRGRGLCKPCHDSHTASTYQFGRA